MLFRLMRRPLLLLALPVLAAVAVACGTDDIDLASSSPDYAGAELFAQRCSSCHTLDVVGSEGSAEDPNKREYKDGPNFNERKEDYESVLYAIRNGGFSSGPMPQNIVVGREAEQVARFVEKYSGRSAAEGIAP
jgi:mono/diheme cytochrome c family protein